MSLNGYIRGGGGAKSLKTLWGGGDCILWRNCGVAQWGNLVDGLTLNQFGRMV